MKKRETIQHSSSPVEATCLSRALCAALCATFISEPAHSFTLFSVSAVRATITIGMISRFVISGARFLRIRTTMSTPWPSTSSPKQSSSPAHLRPDVLDSGSSSSKASEERCWPMSESTSSGSAYEYECSTNWHGNGTSSVWDVKLSALNVTGSGLITISVSLNRVRTSLGIGGYDSGSVGVGVSSSSSVSGSPRSLDGDSGIDDFDGLAGTGDFCIIFLRRPRPPPRQRINSCGLSCSMWYHGNAPAVLKKKLDKSERCNISIFLENQRGRLPVPTSHMRHHGNMPALQKRKIIHRCLQTRVMNVCIHDTIYKR